MRTSNRGLRAARGRRTTAVVALAAAVLAGGCTVDGDGPSGAGASATTAGANTTATPRWEQLPAPESPTDGRLASNVTSVLGATDGSPALLVGSTGTRPAAPRATVWAFGDTGWSPTTLPDGEGLTVTTAVDDGTQTWLAGWRWGTDTGVSAALLSSTDRVSWQERSNGAPDGAYPAALVPSDAGLVLLGRTVDEVPFSWRPDDAEAWVPLPLPDGARRTRPGRRGAPGRRHGRRGGCGRLRCTGLTGAAVQRGLRRRGPHLAPRWVAAR